ncbi:adenine deaminase [Methanobrevibacter sp. DSM 116169]|uniref:adenine deaminase n=1 Tax=Methanobrevibacter sp. DSM 116169 TaxID=3242727 RepID=UPI0038FBFD6E
MEFTAYMLDVYTNFVYPAIIKLDEDIIEDVTPIVTDDYQDVDFEGILLPGFIDSHIHIESSMLTPSQFAKVAVSHGTTSVIADPHEIANVCGVDGVELMIENANSSPLNFYFTAPSCVPATGFETSGARLSNQEIEQLFIKDEVIGLGEMMNFPGVINEDIDVINKLDLAISYQKPIDGHAPLLSGEELEKYVSKGIYTDHECSSFDEAIEKKKFGMKIMVRDGSSAKNMEALFDYDDRMNFLENSDLFDEIPFDEFEQALEKPFFDFLVSDDKNPKDLLKGHLNESIKKAADIGIDVIEAIKMVTINPASYYELNSGAISNGKKANFVLVDSLDSLNVKKTFINGKIVYDEGETLFDSVDFPITNTFNLNPKNSEDFDIKYDKDGLVNVNVIKINNDDIVSEKINEDLKVENNVILPDLDKDILKISVVERYGGNTMANAFIKGFNIKNAAMGLSVSHDSHNIVVVGSSSELLKDVTNLIAETNGGIAIVYLDDEGNKKEEILKLPIAGLMSNEECEVVSEKLESLQNVVKSLGCKLDSPFMSLSFMSLLVIPELKLSNKGLFDVGSFSFIDVVNE